MLGLWRITVGGGGSGVEVEVRKWMSIEGGRKSILEISYEVSTPSQS